MPDFLNASRYSAGILGDFANPVTGFQGILNMGQGGGRYGYGAPSMPTSPQPGFSPVPNPQPARGWQPFVQNNSDMLMGIGSALLSSPNLGMALASFGQQAPQIMARGNKRRALRTWIDQNGKSLDPSTRALMAADPELASSVISASLTPKPYSAVSTPNGDVIAFDPLHPEKSQKVFGSGNAYGGQSMDGQNWNILLRKDADPASPEYAAAYNQLFETPKLVNGQDSEGRQIVTPVYAKPPPSIRPPSYQGGSNGASPGGASGAPGYGPAAAGGAMPGQPGSGMGGAGAPMVVGNAKLTEQQIRNRQLYNTVQPEVAIIDKNFNELADLGNQAGGALPGIGNFTTSEGYQRASNSLRTIIASYLYSTSGATANPGEVDNQTRVLMPAPGDSPKTLSDKLNRIHTMVDSIRIAAESSPPMPGPISPPRPGPSSAPPPAAVSALRNNPALRDQFDAKYGPGAAADVLGQ